MRQRSDGAVTVLRRRFDVAFGWIGAVLLLAYILYGLFHPFPGSDLADQMVLIAIGLIPSWLCWLMTAHPKIVLDSEGMKVVNWFTKSWVPWSAIDSVEVEDGLKLVLRGGGVLKLAAGAQSLASTVGGYRLQKTMKFLIKQGRESGAADEVGVVKTRLDLCPVPFISIAVVYTVIGWLVVR